jgi:chorismate mutase
VTLKALLLLVSVPILLATGCATRTAVHDPALQAQIGIMTFEVAVQVYQAGEYGKAGALFEDAAQSTADPVLESKARFGQIAALLAGAATEEEYALALASWEEWSAGGGEAPVADPRLLPRIMAVLEERARSRSEQGSPGVPDNAVFIEINEMERMQQSIRDREKENAVLRERIAALEARPAPPPLNETLLERKRENEALRERIAVLESIIATVDAPETEELQMVPAEEMLRMVDAVEEKELENQRLRERLGLLEQKFAEMELEQQGGRADQGGGTELSMENERLREKLEALEQLHLEMLERKRTLYTQ